MKKILVLGAGFLQDFVIRKAKTMGYEVIAVDANPASVGFSHADKYKVINIVDEKACLAYAKEEKIDGVLTAATDYGVLTAAYIAKELGLPGLNYEVAKLIKNKHRVRRCLYENHADDTEQAYEVNRDTDVNALAERIVFPVMVKPCDGSGSRGASRVDAADALEQACCFAMNSSASKRAIVETFVFGKEYGAESIVVNGEVYVLGIMKKCMTEPPYYAELGHAMPSDLPEVMEEKAKHCVERAIKALGINFGSVNMDMLITDDGTVHIVDIGARMGGNLIGSHIIPFGTGIDYMGDMIKNVVGDSGAPRPVAKPTAVATRLLAFKNGLVMKLPDFNKIEQECGVEIYHHLEVGQAISEYHTNLDGCGYIVAKADRVETASANADKALNLIQKEIFSAD